MVYSVSFSNKDVNDIELMVDWCNQNLGFGGWYDTFVKENHFPEDRRWVLDMMVGVTIFYFRKEEDCNWFLLRWA